MKKNIDFHTGISERISYGSYFTAQLIFYGMIMSFLVPYFTDIGIPALTVASLTIIVKIWDAVNDPLFGGIVDKIRFKKGRFLPWVKISVVVIPLATILLFAAPTNLSLSFKVIWVSAAYILWDIAYTICDVPIFALVTTMTNRIDERNLLLSITRIFSGIGVGALIIILPIIRQTVGGWLPATILFSAIGLVLMLPVCVKAKERFVGEMPEKGFTLKEMLHYLVSNKYLLIFNIALMIYSCGNIQLTMYVARYNLGNEAMMGFLSMMSMFPAILLSFFLPFLVKRFDKFAMLLISMVSNIVICAAMVLVGYRNLTGLLIMSVLRGFASGGVMSFGTMFTPDLIEYGRYKTGLGVSGIGFSIAAFSSKLQAAFVTVFTAMMLSVIGFIEGEGAVQSDGFTDRLWLVYCIFPVICALIALPLFSKYKLRDKYVTIMARLTGKKPMQNWREKFRRKMCF